MAALGEQVAPFHKQMDCFEPLPLVIESLDTANVVSIASGFSAQHAVAITGALNSAHRLEMKSRQSPLLTSRDEQTFLRSTCGEEAT